VPAHPVRTCVGCRERAAKQDLLRVVARGDGSSQVLVPDPGGRLTGRGAYLHRSTACLDQALRRRAFPRALRVPGPLEAAELSRLVEGVEDAEQIETR
jgi:predicted RNA-binding protein YlxR (DUF448 family)